MSGAGRVGSGVSGTVRRGTVAPAEGELVPRPATSVPIRAAAATIIAPPTRIRATGTRGSSSAASAGAGSGTGSGGARSDPEHRRSRLRQRRGDRRQRAGILDASVVLVDLEDQLADALRRCALCPQPGQAGVELLLPGFEPREAVVDGRETERRRCHASAYRLRARGT